MILENGLSAPYLIEEWMNFDQTYIYCDLEFIIDTIYFNNMSIQIGVGGGGGGGWGGMDIHFPPKTLF